MSTVCAKKIHIGPTWTNMNVIKTDFLPHPMNTDNVQRAGEEMGEEGGWTQRGREQQWPPHKAGCDFNMGGSQSHYRLQSEEHRGQT